MAVDQVSSGDGEEEGLSVPRLSKIQEEDGDMDDDLRSVLFCVDRFLDIVCPL